ALSRCEARRKELEERIAAGAENLAGLRGEVTAEAESLGAFPSEVQALREANGREEESLASWSQAVAEERGRWERAKSEVVAATALVRTLEQSLVRLSESLEASERERLEWDGRLEAMEIAAGALKNSLLVAEQQEKSARAALDESRGRSSQAEIDVA